MKVLIPCWLIICLYISAYCNEKTFDDILARVTKRDSITKAILTVDQNRSFKLENDGERVKVTIWMHLKTLDPNQEIHIFPQSDVTRQEFARLQHQEELNKLITRCERSEQQYRISQFKKFPVRAGMPYAEAKELLKHEFKLGEPCTEKGAFHLESETHIMVFRHNSLVDIITKVTSNKR